LFNVVRIGEITVYEHVVEICRHNVFPFLADGSMAVLLFKFCGQCLGKLPVFPGEDALLEHVLGVGRCRQRVFGLALLRSFCLRDTSQLAPRSGKFGFEFGYGVTVVSAQALELEDGVVVVVELLAEFFGRRRGFTTHDV
jgi:hypothetical protein